MKGTLLILVGISLVPACAGQAPPAIGPTLPALIIPDTLGEDERICVPRDPFHDPRPTCITVGALRRQLRGRALAGLDP